MIRSLVKFYYGAAFGSVLFMNGYNVGIDGSTFRHIFKFDFYFVTAITIFLTLFLHWYSRKRLLPLNAMFDQRGSAAGENKAFDVLTRFPREVFMCVFMSGVLFSIGYHSLELFWFHFRTFDELVVRHLIVEQTFNALLSFLYFITVRTVLNPYVRKLSKVEILADRVRSFVSSWMWAFFACLLMTIVPQMWFIRNVVMRNDRPHVYAILVISGIAFLLSGLLMYMLFSHFQKEIRALTDAMGRLSRIGHLSQKRKLTVTSKDEIGQLASLFNELHAKAAKEYEDLQNDLRLAASVQRMLLPNDNHDFGGVTVRCFHESAKEVGGDFYDCVMLPDGRVTVVFGEVSGKGLPAALMMTATVMLLKTEMRRGGTAGDMITRLNEAIMDTANGEVLVNLGLAVIEPETGTVEYASAGQASPFVMQEGGARLIITSSLPLGTSADTVYGNHRWEQKPGDRLLFYTSGLIEQFRNSPEENGFLTFQRLLDGMPLHIKPDKLTSYILSELKRPAANQADKTLLIAEFSGRRPREERRYA